MSPTTAQTLTIGKLAKAAGVVVETIRYYQLRDLLPVPATSGAFRHYPASLRNRIRFIKRARKIAHDRLDQIQIKLNDLNRMKKSLSHLVHECENIAKELPCPIIASLTHDVCSSAH